MAQSINHACTSSLSSTEHQHREEFIKNIEEGKNDLIKRVLDDHPSYANAESRTKKTTALITAIRKQNIEIIQLLIDCNANVEKCGGRFLESPLFYAIATQNPTVLDILLTKCDVNKKMGDRQFTALHEAVDRRNKDAVSKLLNHPHINPNIQAKDLVTPLHIAVSNDSTEIVKILLDIPGRIDITISNQDGLTADKVNTGGFACKIVEEYKNQSGTLVRQSSGRVPTESILREEPIIAQEESNPSSPISDLPVPFPSVARVQNEPNAGAQDSYNSMNESSLPTDVVSPGYCPSYPCKEEPDGALDLSSRSDNADRSPEMYSSCGNDSFVLNRHGMGSIPTQSMENDDRRVALPSNQQNTSISTDEVQDSGAEINCPLQKVNESDHTSSNSEEVASVTQGLTMEELKYNHIEKLANKLDAPSQFGNYKELGLAIFRNNAELQININGLHLSSHGGGSPADAFIECIKIKGHAPCELCVFACELKRQDIINILQKSDDITDFDMLEPNVLRNITNLLDVNTPGVSNWREFAQKFGCSDIEINAFATAVTSNFVFSPTEALITLVKNNLPRYKLADLKKILTEMDRNDVVCVLDEIISEI